ncbi:hypothetical protein BJV78DRAFT_1215172 [Lactifluus subvellereus]|nr:hypothetical protein BJV78DRAFT_1215172 [Lactifluus subvellereus]
MLMLVTNWVEPNCGLVLISPLVEPTSMAFDALLRAEGSWDLYLRWHLSTLISFVSDMLAYRDIGGQINGIDGYYIAFIAQLPDLCMLTNYMPRGPCRHYFAIVEHHDSVNTSHQCSSGRDAGPTSRSDGLVDNQSLVSLINVCIREQEARPRWGCRNTSNIRGKHWISRSF